LIIEEIDEHIGEQAEALIRLVKPLNLNQIQIVLIFSTISRTGRLFAEALVSGAQITEGKSYCIFSYMALESL